MDGGSMREIRKRFDTGLSNIKTVYGCYVNAAREIVATMEIPVLEMDAEEREMYSNLFKATVSGPDGRHLHDISIAGENPEGSDEYKLLASLNEKRLEDESMRSLLYERIMENYINDENSYAILLATDTYDLKYKQEDEEEWSEDSVNQFTYFVCSICRVKDPKAALRYVKGPKEFRGASTGSVLAEPMHGFMFPAFVKRQALPNTATYFTGKVDNIHEELIETLFGTSDMPEPALTKKEALKISTEESLEENYTLEAAAILTKMVTDRISEDEEGNTNPDILITDIADVYRNLPGMDDEKADRFIDIATERLGDSVTAATIVPKNRAFVVSTPEAQITIDSENAVMLSTKMIDGVLYILVPAGEDVLVNGQKVYIREY